VRPRVGLVALVGIVVAIATVGCTRVGAPAAESTPPWKVGASVNTVSAAPDAGGPLSLRNCPTLEAAAAAVPGLVSGPDANAVPFKTMVLQCSYSLAELDIQARPAGVGILVFDASGDRTDLWANVLDDPAFPGPMEIPGLGDRSFATGTAGHQDLWVVADDFGFHVAHTRQGPIELDQMIALAREMLVGLERSPR
jgi:hypothetical protein